MQALGKLSTHMRMDLDSQSIVFFRPSRTDYTVHAQLNHCGGCVSDIYCSIKVHVALSSNYTDANRSFHQRKTKTFLVMQLSNDCVECFKHRPHNPFCLIQNQVELFCDYVVVTY